MLRMTRISQSVKGSREYTYEGVIAPPLSLGLILGVMPEVWRLPGLNSINARCQLQC